MAETSGYFPGVEYDESFVDAQTSAIVTNGVYSGELQVVSGVGMQVKVKTGRAWINGKFYKNTPEKIIPISTADGAMGRIDSIVLRRNVNSKAITAMVVKGTPASIPTASPLVRTSEIYDLCIATILVPAGSTGILQSNITDKRTDSASCGIVVGAVQQIDATGLFSQYDSAFQEFMSSVEGSLSGDVAGNLLNLINAHTSDTTKHLTTAERTKWNRDTVHSLTHSKAGTVHKLTGATGLSGLVASQFKATAPFVTGDTVQVDGVSYTATLSNGEPAEDNLFVSGASVPIILDTAGKKVNFKAAGGAKLPAGTTAIVKIFTANGTFTVPQTGKYRVTVIGKGGDGGNGTNIYHQESGRGGGGGGSGGAAQSVLALNKGGSYTVTVSDATSSFGSALTASAGGTGARGQNNSGGYGGYGGSASGGNSFNYKGGEGGSTSNGDAGVDGVFTSAAAAACKYLCDRHITIKNQSIMDGQSNIWLTAAGFSAYGCGAYGAFHSRYDTDGGPIGGTGCFGVVIIEFVLE